MTSVPAQLRNIKRRQHSLEKWEEKKDRLDYEVHLEMLETVDIL